MVLFHGGPISVPEDQTECRYRRWGRVGRAARDVSPLAVTTIGGVLVMFFVTSLAVGLVSVPQKLPLWIKGAVLFTILVGGMSCALLLLFLWSLRPGAWKRHWKLEDGPFNTAPPESGDHTGFWLRSRHWHTVLNLRCIITDPIGQVREAGPWTVRGNSRVLLAPGHTGGGFSYPRDFNAPWPTPGTYRVRWEMDAEERTKPVVLGTGCWTVTE